MTGIEELAVAGAEWWGGLSAGTQAAVGATAASAAGAGISAALAPKAPGVKAPVTMPDQTAIDQARRRSLVQQMARRGRASTIFTDTSGDALG